MDEKDWPATVALPGVVSEGTLNADHLIPIFLRLLDDLDSESARDLRGQVPNPMFFSSHGDYLQDLQEYELALFEKLEELAPDGYWFGSHEGDPACIGFWESDDEDDE